MKKMFFVEKCPPKVVLYILLNGEEFSRDAKLVSLLNSRLNSRQMLQKILIIFKLFLPEEEYSYFSKLGNWTILVIYFNTNLDKIDILLSNIDIKFLKLN